MLSVCSSAVARPRSATGLPSYKTSECKGWFKDLYAERGPSTEPIHMARSAWGAGPVAQRPPEGGDSGLRHAVTETSMWAITPSVNGQTSSSRFPVTERMRWHAEIEPDAWAGGLHRSPHGVRRPSEPRCDYCGSRQAAEVHPASAGLANDPRPQGRPDRDACGRGQICG